MELEIDKEPLPSDSVYSADEERSRSLVEFPFH